MSYRISSFIFLSALLFSFAPVTTQAEVSVPCTRLSTYLQVDNSANNVNEVIALQDFLRTQGFFNAKSTGYFGALTEIAVKEFQSANGLEPVGVVGPQTRARIESVSCTETESGGGSSGGAGSQGTTGGAVTGGGSQTTTGTSVGGTTVDFRASINERKDWYDAPTSNPLVITADQMLYMTWTATNATACSPSAPIADIQTPVVASYFNGNTWIQFAPGSVPLGGGTSHYPAAGQTITYTITCTGPNGGTATDSVTVRNAKPAVSKVDLKINGADGDLINAATQYLVNHNNVKLKVNQPLTFSWDIVGGAECQLYSVADGVGANVNFSANLGKEFSSLPSSLTNASSFTINPGQPGYPSPGWVNYVLTCGVANGTGGTDLGVGYGQRYVRGDQITVTVEGGTVTPPTTPTTPTTPTKPTTPINPIVPPTTGTTGTSGSACVIITSPILEGSSGSEVTALQNFLRTKGYFNANTTGFFGPITAKAVSAFQEANGLESVGSVGPLTRAKIQSISCGTNTSVTSTPITTSTESSGTSGTGIVVTIKAKPPIATTGLNSTLTWSAPSALSCTASGAWSGPRGPVGEQIIGPLYGAGTYGLTCRNETSSGYGSVAVSVQSGDTPSTGSTGSTGGTGTSGTNTGTTNTTGGTVGGNFIFAVGDTVSTLSSVAIKSIANVTATNLATVPVGTRGTVWGGPVMVNGENWWNISFQNVAVGWVGEKSLTKVASGGLTTNFVVPGSNVSLPVTVPTNLASCPAFDYDVSKAVEANGQIPNPNVLYIIPTGWTRNTNVVPNTVTVPGMGTFTTFPTIPTQINYNYSTPTPVGCGGFLFSDNTVRNAKGAVLRDLRAEGAAPLFIGGGKTSSDVFRQTNGAPLVISPASICELAGVPAGNLCTNFLK